MNIIEAVKALKEGKKVKATSWKNSYCFLEREHEPPNVIMSSYDGIKQSFTPENILGEWEIYEEPSLMEKEWEDYKFIINDRYSAEQMDIAYAAWCSSWYKSEKHFTSTKSSNI